MTTSSVDERVPFRPKRPAPRPDVDLLSRAVEKVGPIGLGALLYELARSAA